ncbi:hypothetical protein J5N97_022956 [Dioscorea zingiberensis]|uniref:Uncharacterized protein n=1 Tax=Dioscorea zingiberensis TaxID=325984 RepID=A0A9D5CBR0_9LILI|nr:hypothetical protein J5N97_022956 [Dioscorea zingiberensis]
MSLPHHTLSPSLFAPPKIPTPFSKTRPFHGATHRLQLKGSDGGGVVFSGGYGVNSSTGSVVNGVAKKRFQRKEDLAKFHVNASYLGVLKEHVKPHCYGLISLEYESEVEDDIMPIFRRGEEFNYGVECVFLISFFETASGHAVEDALATLQSLIIKFGSLIIQATQGQCFNLTDSEYTHAAVIRFPSFDAMEMFRGTSDYKDMWRLKFQKVTRKALLIYFTVDPVGIELM